MGAYSRLQETLETNCKIDLDSFLKSIKELPERDRYYFAELVLRATEWVNSLNDHYVDGLLHLAGSIFGECDEEAIIVNRRNKRLLIAGEIDEVEIKYKRKE